MMMGEQVSTDDKGESSNENWIVMEGDSVDSEGSQKEHDCCEGFPSEDGHLKDTNRNVRECIKFVFLVFWRAIRIYVFGVFWFVLLEWIGYRYFDLYKIDLNGCFTANNTFQALVHEWYYVLTYQLFWPVLFYHLIGDIVWKGLPLVIACTGVVFHIVGFLVVFSMERDYFGDIYTKARPVVIPIWAIRNVLFVATSLKRFYDVSTLSTRKVSVVVRLIGIFLIISGVGLGMGQTGIGLYVVVQTSPMEKFLWIFVLFPLVKELAFILLRKVVLDLYVLYSSKQLGSSSTNGPLVIFLTYTLGWQWVTRFLTIQAESWSVFFLWVVLQAFLEVGTRLTHRFRDEKIASFGQFLGSKLKIGQGTRQVSRKHDFMVMHSTLLIAEMMAEQIAIIGAPVLYLLFRQYEMFYDLGYQGEQVSVLFFLLTIPIQLAFEILVDFVCVFFENHALGYPLLHLKTKHHWGLLLSCMLVAGTTYNLFSNMYHFDLDLCGRSDFCACDPSYLLYSHHEDFCRQIWNVTTSNSTTCNVH